MVKYKTKLVNNQSTWYTSAEGLPNLVQIAQTIKTKSVKTRSIRPTCLPEGRSVAQQKKRSVFVPLATLFATFVVKKTKRSVPSVPSVRNKKAKRPPFQ